MSKEVTVRGLNSAYMHELFSARMFWWGLILYALGIACMNISFGNFPFGASLMLIGVLIMLNADWRGRQRVVKRLRWV